MHGSRAGRCARRAGACGSRVSATQRGPRTRSMSEHSHKSERSQFRLLAERRFGPFFAVQFLGAMNDNVFKQALVILLAYQTASFTSMSSDLLQNLAQALFVLPFFIFSATAGQLADKYEKGKLITVTVVLELAIMVLGAIGLMSTHLVLLLCALFLGGVQSALFGPVKYAILPQHLDETELVGGNGLVEMGTSLAILGGMMLGGWMVTQPGWGVAGVAVLTCALSAAGIVLSRLIPLSPPADPGLRINWNPITETANILRFTARSRTVFLSVLGISWFWFYGALLVTQFPNLSRNVLGAGEAVVTLLLVAFSLGIGLGSLLCERLSGHKVEIGLVPFGSIGLTVFALDLWLATRDMHATGLAGIWQFLHEPGHVRVVADLVLIGLFGGFYIVPLYALVQERSEPAYRARIIAANNILNAIFMVASAGFAIALLGTGLTIPYLFLTTAILNAVIALFIYKLVPEFLMRFLAWILIHTMYRVKKEGLDNVPETGPCIVVCNHVSYVDAIVIAACVRRPIRFVMDHRIFRFPILNW